jgi:hypothetical protein
MTRVRPSRLQAFAPRRSTPWLLVLLVLFGHLYARAHDAFELHVECAEHPGEWTHADPSHGQPAHDSKSHDSHGGEHGHCSLPHLSAPSAQPLDATPLLIDVAVIAEPLPAAPIARFPASTPLLRLAPKTSPPTTC